MIAIQLKFQRSGSNGHVYCTVTQNNTDFNEWTGTSTVGQYCSIFGTNEIGYISAIINYIDHFHCTPQLNNKYHAITAIVSPGNLLSLINSLYKLQNPQLFIMPIITKNIVAFSIELRDNAHVVAHLGLFQKYAKSDIIAMIQGLAPSQINGKAVDTTMEENTKKGKKPANECDGCRAVLEKSKLKEFVTSSGKKLKLCVYCGRTVECGLCKYPEPTPYVTGGIRINDQNGQNENFSMCDKCRSRGYARCRHCGNYFDTKIDKECPCQIRFDFKGSIQAHNADVLNFYPKDSYCQELFGIEIEVGTLNKNRRIFPDIANFTLGIIENNAILKYDSSIDYLDGSAKQIPSEYRGFEVVTRPMVYKNALRFLKNFCKSCHPLLRSWEVGTCGLHIHVSKACLRPFEIGKILLFINSKYNRPFIKMIAKREDKKYAKFLTKKIMDYRNNSPNCHYEAVNTNKKFTIEFRIFRGTLNIRTIISYLQFVKSLIDFVKVTPKSDLTYTRYTDYLFSTEKSRFRELKERIRSENTKEIREKDEI